MKKNLICIITAVLCSSFLYASADSTHFGTFSVQINDAPPRTYLARNAILYRSVALHYDRSLVIQGQDLRQQLFYVQLAEGTHNVLHLILDATTAEVDSGWSYSYDVYFDLGDTLSEFLSVEGVDSMAFVFPNGEFVRGMRYARNQTGQFRLQSDPRGQGVTGALDTQFSYPLTADPAIFDRIALSGKLQIPESRLRQGGPGGISAAGRRKSNLGRNLLLSAILTAVLAATVLLSK